MISVSNLAKAFGDRCLFRDVSLRFNGGDRYGVVGANGSGKSTFLRILSGEIPPSEGSVAVPKKVRVGTLRQDQFLYEDQPVLDVVLMGNREFWDAWRAKESLLAAPPEQFDAHRFAELEEVVQRHDGYSQEARAAMILEGLGIAAETHRCPLSTLSGGFKLRVLLAQALAADPDLLLLDEPTNHLDILSIRWLEEFLQGFRGCVLVVTHDHRFLDRVCTHIADVDYETITIYPGNYSRFAAAKREERERRETEIARQEKQIEEHRAFVERFRAKATKARQAQSKLKAIERIDVRPLPRSSRRYPAFRFSQCRPSGKQVLEVLGVSRSYGDNRVLDDVTFELRRGERMAVIGPNGIGKSTLLKAVMGEIEVDGGEVGWGYETHPGYFPQDHQAVFAGSSRTVEDWLWDACAGEPIGYVRGQLGRVLFSGDDVKKKVSALSGGEAARLLFCRLAVRHPNVLVLDEPTNHLDLESIEALVDGLDAYDGTLLLVSHDRWFVSRLATRILEITRDGIRDFPGGYDEFVERHGDDHLDAEQAVLRVRREGRRSRRGREAAGRPADRDDGRSRERESLQARRTEQIEDAERRLQEIHRTFCRPGYFETAPAEEVARLKEEHETLTRRLSRMMEEWERAEEELAPS